MGQGASSPLPGAGGGKPSEKEADKDSKAPDLQGVSTQYLLSEVQRRLNCLNKPDKHIILVGKFSNTLDADAGSGLAIPL